MPSAERDLIRRIVDAWPPLTDADKRAIRRIVTKPEEPTTTDDTATTTAREKP